MSSQAERLGVMVPGVPGYIPMRERNHMTWAKSDGTESPDWWEVQGKEQPENPIDAPPSLDLLHDTTGDFVSSTTRLACPSDPFIRFRLVFI